MGGRSEMTMSPAPRLSLADREIIVAEINVVAAELSRLHETLPGPLQANALRLGHSLVKLRTLIEKVPRRFFRSWKAAGD